VVFVEIKLNVDVVLLYGAAVMVAWETVVFATEIEVALAKQVEGKSVEKNVVTTLGPSLKLTKSSSAAISANAPASPKTV
jgi:hypothetical protein